MVSKPRRKTIRLHHAAYAQPELVAMLTMCTSARRRVFAHSDHAEFAVGEIRRLHGNMWRILGYCVMPDHVHLMALNLDGKPSDLVRLFKGRTSMVFRGLCPAPLWQRSYHDHLLRRNEDIVGVMRYMMENPVRAGLQAHWMKYPWCGSMQWPEMSSAFFETRASDVLWSEIEMVDSDRCDRVPGQG